MKRKVISFLLVDIIVALICLFSLSIENREISEYVFNFIILLALLPIVPFIACIHGFLFGSKNPPFLTIAIVVLLIILGFAMAVKYWKKKGAPDAGWLILVLAWFTGSALLTALIVEIGNALASI